MHWTRWLLAAPALLASASASAAEQPQNQERYALGQAIPVSCQERNTTTGEHLADEEGRLLYKPFPICSETGKPLELGFGVEKEFNCTIEITRDLFHLLEFYIHSDAPLACRIPARPITSTTPPAPDSAYEVGVQGSEDTHYIPLVVALTGIMQTSHVHVATSLNVLVHAAPRALAPGVIDAATAYSVSQRRGSTRVIIGSSLPLRLAVRWYPSTALPSGWAGVGGHVFLSTLVYCLLSAGAATAVCVAYYRGVALPKRLRSHGWERAFASDRDRAPAPRYNGYGYGVGNGYGYAGPGKVD